MSYQTIDQGCQIFLVKIYQNGEITHITTKLQNVHKIYQMAVVYSKCP
jgi:hypothetical protein